MAIHCTQSEDTCETTSQARCEGQQTPARTHTTTSCLVLDITETQLSTAGVSGVLWRIWRACLGSATFLWLWSSTVATRSAQRWLSRERVGSRLTRGLEQSHLLLFRRLLCRLACCLLLACLSILQGAQVLVVSIGEILQPASWTVQFMQRYKSLKAAMFDRTRYGRSHTNNLNQPKCMHRRFSSAGLHTNHLYAESVCTPSLRYYFVPAWFAKFHDIFLIEGSPLLEHKEGYCTPPWGRPSSSWACSFFCSSRWRPAASSAPRSPPSYRSPPSAPARL